MTTDRQVFDSIVDQLSLAQDTLQAPFYANLIVMLQAELESRKPDAITAKRYDLQLRHPDASFAPVCGNCGGEHLLVTAATLVATGERVRVGEHLGLYGFIVPQTFDMKDGSTTDELVVCLDCKHDFDLSEVTL